MLLPLPGLPLTRISACLHADLVNDTRTRTFRDFIADLALKNSLILGSFQALPLAKLGKFSRLRANLCFIFSQN